MPKATPTLPYAVRWLLNAEKDYKANGYSEETWLPCLLLGLVPAGVVMLGMLALDLDNRWFAVPAVLLTAVPLFVSGLYLTHPAISEEQRRPVERENQRVMSILIVLGCFVGMHDLRSNRHDYPFFVSLGLTIVSSIAYAVLAICIPYLLGQTIRKWLNRHSWENTGAESSNP